MLALQLVDGQPEVILEGSRGSLKLQVETMLLPGTWHTLHLHLDAQVCKAALILLLYASCNCFCPLLSHLINSIFIRSSISLVMYLQY